MKQFFMRLIMLFLSFIIGVAVLVGALAFKILMLPLAIVAFFGILVYFLFFREMDVTARLLTKELRSVANF